MHFKVKNYPTHCDEEVGRPEVILKMSLDLHLPRYRPLWTTLTSNMDWGGHHSSVVLFVPTILRPRVRIPITPSTLFFNLY